MKRCLGKLVFSAIASAGLLAQTLPAGAAAQPGPVATNSVPDPLLPPPPAPLKSPVSHFRELLVMSPGERQKYLAGRSLENRKLILDKIHAYQALSPEQRELQLEVTELRWYLWPLMQMPATNRAPRLNSIPAEMRKLVEARLRIWDLLPQQVQDELLQNEAMARMLREIVNGTIARTNLPPQFQTNLAAWFAMSEEKRRRISQLFDMFLGLRPDEQQAVLRRISGPESRQLEKTLSTFQHLTPLQRSQCVRSFGKFASLTPEERKQFYHDVHKWEQMTPTERQTWRDLVESISLQPPLPTMVPPMPPGARQLPARRLDTATNN